MIIIEKLEESHVTLVQAIQLADEQVKFAGTAAEFLLDGSDTTHLHVIKSDNEVVGFFKLDIAYAEHYEFCPEGSIGLRAFAVDKNQQGKGLGTGAVKALFPYLKANYAKYDSIYLTVNCKNPAAFNCYKKGGFEDSVKQYLGGAAGPQFIMRGRIA
ncbi:GNAT family N-acetyltransferase [Vibrio sp. 10N.261.46.E12]|uniref:GNAT family N-acetyltransferase n=1 Tax=unclassified Vibrio TaxID=2614977 RepID=UPI0009762D5E|nr:MULTISPECIES: GNAT family N-acetyltransferase [unclassified Vibrio]OMO38201.1 GNAT family N-acetyltransferase [Vibrio sp. 10N.261.45.E1]PMJ21299.1 GNAT family N-acetyltransferase [Vibrio sp. 10N.286.45.B6]PML84538.1 GNAT family N-acetyltransferase [Vibrio sp. 10N.261.49.E11]PMM64415.1 GNAT family N-acetyltransferase [Vibrio sp. 10N.261.46.F12]PMM78843.1 GNAT family N-acetyltransferase [Vibrio sp. 10N.261.46.E8]